MGEPQRVSLARLFSAFDTLHSRQSARQSSRAQRERVQTALERHMSSYTVSENLCGFKRMRNCRRALEALDRRGWQRSFHQRLFHEEYMKACARVFFKRDGPGAFARSTRASWS